jgi:hypothetical protein
MNASSRDAPLLRASRFAPAARARRSAHGRRNEGATAWRRHLQCVPSGCVHSRAATRRRGITSDEMRHTVLVCNRSENGIPSLPANLPQRTGPRPA